MRRALLATLTVVALVGLLAMPAGANHLKTPVTITVSSAHAAVCGAVPGDGPVGVTGFQNALSANQLAADSFSIPADLGNGSAAGVCDFGTDALWAASPLKTATCSTTVFTGCAGIHWPGAGAPVKPGRFLQHANGFGPANIASACQFVSTASPFAGACRTAAFGYVLTGDTGLGGYCGSSRGFFWAMASSSVDMTANATFTHGEWKPNSAGTLLPLQLASTGANWGSDHNFTSVTVPANRADTAGYSRSVSINTYGLASARSFLPVDAAPGTPGACQRAPNDGARQFLAQTVTVTLGP